MFSFDETFFFPTRTRSIDRSTDPQVYLFIYLFISFFEIFFRTRDGSMTFRSTLRNIFSEKILFLAKIKQFFRFSSNSSTMKKQSIFVSRTFQSTIVIVSQINCARTRYNDSSRLLLSSTLHTLVRASLKIKRARKDM